MSSGSYFTIYRKCKNVVLEAEKLQALRNEYIDAVKNGLFGYNKDNAKDDIPLLLHDGYKSNSYDLECKNNNFYDNDGILHERLLDFHFGSSFTCLKTEFNLNPYINKESSVFISKDEASKMLQAINYILSNDYSKKFEEILNNKYVDIFGDGYSLFDDRFKQKKDRIYVDKNDDGYMLSFGDEQYDIEVKETDDDIIFSLSRARSAIMAFLEAETYSYDGFELVLEYSVY